VAATLKSIDYNVAMTFILLIIIIIIMMRTFCKRLISDTFVNFVHKMPPLYDTDLKDRFLSGVFKGRWCNRLPFWSDCEYLDNFALFRKLSFTIEP